MFTGLSKIFSRTTLRLTYLVRTTDKFHSIPFGGNDKLIYELTHWQVLRKKQGRYSIWTSRICNVKLGFPCQKVKLSDFKALLWRHSSLTESIVIYTNWTYVEFISLKWTNVFIIVNGIYGKKFLVCFLRWMR